MEPYFVKLRYFPEDPLEEITPEDLERMGRNYQVQISYEKIENRVQRDGYLMEDTMDKAIEEISQVVVTVSSASEGKFSACLKELYKKYRCPRTSYSLLGSNEPGQKIAKGLMHVYGGW